MLCGTLMSRAMAGYIYDFIDKSQWSMAKQKTKGFMGFIK